MGKNAMSGFLALMNAAPADIEKVSSAIANCDGKSAEMAATMQDNLAGQLTILKSQLEELAISFGEILMPAIRQIVTWVQGFVDKLNDMDEGTKNTIVTIGLLAAAIGPVLIIIGKVVSAVGSIMTFIPTLIGGISSIGGGLSALWGILAANPVTLVIAAIAALIAIFVALWNNCEGYSNGVNYSNRECILIVAGGGGGGAIDNGTIHKGGDGGGERGGDGSGGALGGRQISTGSSPSTNFGSAPSYGSSSSTCYSGGGGGWFGGNYGMRGESGAGGSGYVDGVAPFTHNGKYYPAETGAGVNEGHGRAFIRYVECA